MKGKHTIIVQYSDVKFELTVQRNITILRGDSATGKSTIVDMIDRYNRLGRSSRVSIQCDKPCKVLRADDWDIRLETIMDSIVFIDEENEFVKTEEFASAIKHSDNYYVLITREMLPMLPYSINEVFGFKTSDKYTNVKQIYNKAFNLYQGLNAKTTIKPTLIITEDSKAGGQFFSSLGIKCVTTGGKSNIIKRISNITDDDEVLIVADGAALGSEIDAIMKELRVHKNMTLYAPESFEWLLLKSNLFVNGNAIKAVLANPANYIDSKEYFSWERFFTTYIVSITTILEKNNIMIGYKYPSSKDKLPAVYMTKRVRDRILAVIPNIKFK